MSINQKKTKEKTTFVHYLNNNGRNLVSRGKDAETVVMLIYQKELWVQNKKKGICSEKVNTSVPPELITASLAGCVQHLFLSLLTPAPSNFGDQMQVGRGGPS